MRQLRPTFVLFLLTGCQAVELSPSWRIDRLRVLAVAAEPAEPQPGDLVTFSSLTVGPPDAWGMSIWMACFEPEDDDFGCTVDADVLEGFDPETVTPEDLEEAGVIGVEPYWPPTWSVDADALDGVAEADALEGVNAFINLAALPETDDPASIDSDDVELAYKRVPISIAATPNHNPVVTGIRVDGVDVPPGSTLVLDPGQAFTLEAVLADDALETYTYRNSEGQDEARVEEPYVTWYVEEGDFDQSYSVWPDLQVDWWSPAAPELEESTIWVVVRDRRGGMGWYAQPVRIR